MPVPLSQRTVVGIDVGGPRKGFHAVALRHGKFVDRKAHPDPNLIVEWCVNREAVVIAVDAPCRWSRSGSSRLAERELHVSGKKVHCFATPTRKGALRRNFYRWVFNAERLYKSLDAHYPLFDGKNRHGEVCFETFPHAILCAMAGRVVSTKPKGVTRRTALKERGYDVGDLPNIDFVDAALCAVAADAFHEKRCHIYGDTIEGFILIPRIENSNVARSDVF